LVTALVLKRVQTQIQARLRKNDDRPANAGRSIGL
jgi:hypothetical protein